jgi:GT2 family glycosyltransferase
MKDVMIVVLTFDRLPYTKRCLDALLLTRNKFDCLIVDNGSKQDTVDYLSSYDGRETDDGAKFRVIFNGRNLGVGGGMNVALQQRRDDQHLMKLDNDVVVSSKMNNMWLSEMVELLESDIGISHLGFCFFTSADMRLVKKVTCRRKTRWTCNLMRPENGLILGAGVLFRNSVVTKVGKFNDRRLYGNIDTDYSRRCLAYGQGWYWMDVKAEHIDKRDLGDDTERLDRIKEEARHLY